MTIAERHFLSWVRDGLAARLVEPTDPGRGAVPARASLAAEVAVNGVAVPGPTLVLHGPGDVTGLDPRQIIRTDPTPAAISFEANHLALIEFDDPGLPWRLTPVAPHEQRGLRPWLVLVVLDTSTQGVSVATEPRAPLPILQCPVAELPDLAGSASWAHAEVVAAQDENLAAVLAERPERSVSRLIAPRRLQPARSYVACLVPAFEHGRLAGLGLPVPDTATTEPAWGGVSGSVRLPVYHHWTFATGPDGDFATLARLLRPAVAEPGWRTLFYKAADPELTARLGDDPGLLTLLPALTAPGVHATDRVNDDYAAGMATILRRAGEQVTPPIYLGDHSGHSPGWSGTEPLWLRELNLDPRLRAAAGLGAEVVRIHQEALMAAAWRQAAQLDQANRELRQGQLGRAVSASLHRRHFLPAGAAAAGLSLLAGFTATPAALEQADTVLARSAPALRRLATQAGTLAGELATHEATASTASPEVQRAVRPTGPAAKAAGATALQPLPSVLGPVATSTIVPAPPVRAAADAGVLDRYVGDRVGYRDITEAVVNSADPWWRYQAQWTQPLVTPGPVAYLSDLTVLAETPPAGAGAPPSLSATALRGMDFDGLPRPPEAPIALPADATLPDVRLVGARLARNGTPQPRLLLAGVRNGLYVDSWEPCLRWVDGVSDGRPTAGPWQRLPYTQSTRQAVDMTLRRRSGHPDSEPELLVVWVGGPNLKYFIRGYQLGGTVTAGDPRQLPLAFIADPPSDIAVDMVPTVPPRGQPYSEPTDLLVATLRWTVVWVGPQTHSVWQLRWQVGRDVNTARESWTAPQSLTIADRVPEQLTGATIDVRVTDLNGDGEPELIVHLTYDRPGDRGTAQRVTVQRIGYGLRRDGTVQQWDAGRDVAVAPAPGTAVVSVVGDLDDRRLARISAVGDRFQRAAARHQARLVRPGTEAAPEPSAADYQVPQVAADAAGALDPAVTVPASVTARVSGLPAADGNTLAEAGADPLRPRYYEPSFPQAMSEPLRELFPDLVFPAVDALPDNGVALLAGNSALIVAYLAGLNHEFGRELLWRGFPSSGRATWFKHFFDARGTRGAGGGDLRDIADWGSDGSLADKAAGPAAADSVIMVVRGELLRRYPDLVVQAVRGVNTGGGRTPGGEVLLPVFVGRAGADASLFSFDIPADTVRGDASDPGWYFVFAEPPTEPRFLAPRNPQWTGAGGHVAAGLVQQPFRVAIHASDLIAPTGVHA